MEQKENVNDLVLFENEIEQNKIMTDEDDYFEQAQMLDQEIISIINELKTEYMDTHSLINRIQTKNNECSQNVRNKENFNCDNLTKQVNQIVNMDETLEKMEVEEMRILKETIDFQIQLRNDLAEIINDDQDLQYQNKELLENTNAFFKLCKEFRETPKELSITKNEEIKIRKSIQDSKTKEKKSSEQNNLKDINNENKHFIERNIELSVNGLGLLSMTDKEQNRIDNILQENETVEYNDNNNPILLYDLKEIDNELEEIDIKLEKINEINPIQKNNSNEKENYENWKDEIQLQEINKMIKEFSYKDKVIEPVDEKKIAELITISETNKEYFIKLTNDQINELIEETKNKMPFFKYRFLIEKS